MAILKPDKTTTLGGVTVNEYLLTESTTIGIAQANQKSEQSAMHRTWQTAICEPYPLTLWVQKNLMPLSLRSKSKRS